MFNENRPPWQWVRTEYVTNEQNAEVLNRLMEQTQPVNKGSLFFAWADQRGRRTDLYGQTLVQAFELVLHLFRMSSVPIKRQILQDVYASIAADSPDGWGDLLLTYDPELCRQITQLIAVDPVVSEAVKTEMIAGRQVLEANLLQIKQHCESRMVSSTEFGRLHVRLDYIPFFRKLGFAAPEGLSVQAPRTIFGCRNCLSLRVGDMEHLTDGLPPLCCNTDMRVHYFATALCFRQAIQFSQAPSLEDQKKLRLVDELLMSMSDDMRKQLAKVFLPALGSSLFNEPEPNMNPNLPVLVPPINLRQQIQESAHTPFDIHVDVGEIQPAAVQRMPAARVIMIPQGGWINLPQWQGLYFPNSQLSTGDVTNPATPNANDGVNRINEELNDL